MPAEDGSVGFALRPVLLAPDIQEAILFLPRVERGKDPVTERELRAVVRELDWGR